MKLNGLLDFAMGGFLCLRGFASIKDLARVSDPNPAIQRDLIAEHIGEMARFLNHGSYRFFPEVILSLVLTGTTPAEQQEFYDMVHSTHGMSPKRLGDFYVSVGPHPSRGNNADKVKVANISFDAPVRLNRIDGNHRLSAAEAVEQDIDLPYCVLIFRNEDESQQYSRAIFHNINSKQIPLKLEENHSVIIEGINAFSDYVLQTDPSFGPEFILTRQLMREIKLEYFPAVSACIHCARFTYFIDLFRYLLEKGMVQPDNAVQTIKRQLYEIEAALRETEITTTTSNIAIIGAMSYYKLAHPDKYRHFVLWVKKNHIGDVEMLHIDDVINIYDKVYLGVPRKAFLARWYPGETEAEHANAEHRFAKIREVVLSLGLELVDMGTRETGTFDIRTLMWDSLEECDIFIADLTGARHNVMVEVGYALKHIKTGRVVFYFQPTENCSNPPFDLDGFARDPINDSREIEQKVKPRLVNILERAKAGEL